MKVLVSFSGGKDSQASLIYAIKLYGLKNVSALFCDTGHEYEMTYLHINEVCASMGVELITIRSKKYAGFYDLAKQKKRFPSTKARFCTEELKVKPMIDFVLSLKTDVLIVQGIRKDESLSRSKMENECSFFKFYLQPYSKYQDERPRYHTYRKKEVLAHIEQYAAEVIRPVFDWTGQQVIDYIMANDQKPNPLYYMGMKRVGCRPCIMCTKPELKTIIEVFPEVIDQIQEKEIEIGRSFFPPNAIPTHAMANRTFPTIGDVVKYVKGKNETMGVFKEEEPEGGMSCMSYYSLCE